MNSELIDFLENTKKKELKWMYSYDIHDSDFGVETDKYRWCLNVIQGNASVENMIAYFEKYYKTDEQYFIETVKELCN